jgi:hypothetical protein
MAVGDIPLLRPARGPRVLYRANVRYTSWALADGCSDLATLGSDTSRAFAYADANVVEACAANGGLLYDHFLTGHRDAAQKCDELLAAVRSLYEHGSERLQRTMDAYALTEDENVSQVGSIWKVLESGGSSTPIGPAPSGTPTRGPLPSDGLAAPHSDVGGWIFDILSWPDYLSLGYWTRYGLGLLWGALVGGDPWDELWKVLGGDWEGAGLASSAWEELGTYFDASGEELTTRMQIMFAGWYDSDAAAACGGYFATAAKVVADASEPLTEMGTLYHDIAWSSYFLCRSVYNLVDAAADAIAVALCSGATVLEVLGAIVTFGASVVPASVSAVIAIVEALSAAWGWMMTAVYGVVGLGSMLGAATTTVTWVSIPEG